LVTNVTAVTAAGASAGAVVTQDSGYGYSGSHSSSSYRGIYGWALGYGIGTGVEGSSGHVCYTLCVVPASPHACSA